MDEREERPAPGQSEDDAALRLLRLAGRREPVPLEREARLRAAVHAHWRASLAEQRRPRWLWVALPLAAAALIVLAVLAPLLRVAPRVIIGSVEMVAGQVRIDEGGVETQAAVGRQLLVGSLVATGDGGRVALRLDEDASLRLDVASRLAMEAGERIRLESGAVYLDNRPGAPGRGLEIVTPFGSVQDIGTQLEVRLIGDRLRVRVREGMASLRRQDLLATVRAGEEAALGGDGAVQLTRVAADDPGWGWVLTVAPAFPLEGSSAGALLRWAARECGFELRWEPPQLAVAAESIVLHGNVAGLPPNEVPAVVLPTCGLAYRVEGGTLVVSRRER